jgi:cation:H+ antiporter
MLPADLPLWLHAAVIAGSVAMLAWGASLVVDAACRIGRRYGISELVIGLTLVAMGTSAPEFAVTLTSALGGQGDISLANVVGSNIFNLGFILGVCALFHAVPTGPVMFRRDGSVLVLAGLMVLLSAYDLKFARWEGTALCLGLIFYVYWLFRTSKSPGPEGLSVAEAAERGPPAWRDGLIFLAGLVLVVFGARLLVDSSTEVARVMGVSDWVIGVTVVAAGTSAPELAISVTGLVKGRYDISAGNLVGSDIFNMLGVLGVAGLVQPFDVDVASRTSLLGLVMMIGVLLVFMRTGWRVSRTEGVLLILIAAFRWWFDIAGGGS